MQRDGLFYSLDVGSLRNVTAACGMHRGSVECNVSLWNVTVACGMFRELVECCGDGFFNPMASEACDVVGSLWNVTRACGM